MRISTTTDIVSQRFGEEKALAMLAHAGFDCVDYSLFDYSIDDPFWHEGDFSGRISRLGKIGRKHGIGFGQVHAPFPSQTEDEALNQMIFHCLVQSIVAAGLLECPYVVIHPSIPDQCMYDKGHVLALEQNIALYNRLIPIAKENGVKIGLENMFNYDPAAQRICPTCCSTAQEMNHYMDQLGDTMVACLDTGHANLTNDTPGNMARILGNRLHLLHVHDNDGHDDLHTLPFLHKIDWPDFMAALREIEYDGTLSLEADSFIRHMPNALLPDALSLMAKTARYLTTL